MFFNYKKFSWKPSTVSWLSFVLLSLVVTASGIAGTKLIFDYLYEQLMEHGIEHNREIAASLLPKFKQAVKNNPENIARILTHAIDDYKTFGFRILIIDREQGIIIVDSQQSTPMPQKLDDAGLSNVTRLDGKAANILDDSGALLTVSQQNLPMLLWIQTMDFFQQGRFALGIAQNQKALIEFNKNLHFYVDMVMLLVLFLVTLLGYVGMRSIGRFYERSLEARIQQRTQALQQAHQDALSKARLATIGKTATVLTHEMRNPMASIKLALSGLNGSEHLTRREQRRVTMVLSEIDRLDNLLSDTLDYVRPVKRSERPVDLLSLLQEILQQQQAALAQKSIQLEVHNHAALTQCRLDVAQTHQVLLNLLKNAEEACPEQGHIDCYLCSDQQTITLQIINDGIPLDEQTLQHAFDPFFTTKPKGTGLGLGLVKRVVEEHGGSVSIENTQDQRISVCLNFTIQQS